MPYFPLRPTPLCLGLMLLLPPAILPAQRLANLRWEQEGRTLVVYYDILDAEQGQTFDISMRASNSGGRTFPQAMTSLTGDADPGVVPGPGKRAVWNTLADIPQWVGDCQVSVLARVIGGDDFTDTVNGVSFVMKKITVGTFTMGCPGEQGSDCEDWEKPAHTVTLTTDYYLAETEVTQALWRAVMGKRPSRFKNCDECPVEWVSWEDTQEFIHKLNQKTGGTYRLPTEAEWEFAARGGAASKKYKYSGSNDIGAVAWYDENDNVKTHPVKGKAPNELGLYDMSGNVWEWCQDWYGPYSSGSQTDPTGPGSGSTRVIRGGSWDNCPRGCRVANRYDFAPGDRFNIIGFRLASQ